MEILFENIKYKNIRILVDTVIEKTNNYESIKMIYENSAENFQDTINFLEQIGLVGIHDSSISIIDIVPGQKKELPSDDLLKETILSLIFDSDEFTNDFLNEYISQFELVENKLVSVPHIKERMESSSIRNILIELGLVILDKKINGYEIPLGHSFSFLTKHLEKNKLSQDKLDKILENKKEIGDYAENEIVNYEIERLSEHPNLSSKVEKISQNDTKAGYDILSYETFNDDVGTPIKRYIEVKAVNIRDYSFYWSRNEIEKAKQYAKSYYLYLLPVIGKNTFSTNDLKIIKNPYVEIMNNSGWNKQVESYRFYKQNK